MNNICIIIPWKGRPELRNTLAANSALFMKHDAEVIIVNCGGNSEELELLLQGLEIKGLRHVSIPGCSFNRSLARNIGAHCASSRYLFFLDCDIVFKSDVLDEALPLLEAGNCFVTLSRVHETRPTISGLLLCEEKIETLTLRDGRRAVVQLFTANDGTRGGPGLLLVSRENFLAVNGFNSHLVGWGFEDLDFQLRLQFVTPVTGRIIGEAIHLTHAPDGLNGASRAEERQNNMRKCMENYQNGSFMGTFLEDRRKWRLSNRI